MCAVSLNYDTFDKDYYDKRFCEFQINEWNKNLRYYTKKMEKTKTEDLKHKFFKQTEKAKKQLKIYEILINYIYNKKEDQRTKMDQEIAVQKIKEILNS
jgi:hypothetical protein